MIRRDYCQRALIVGLLVSLTLAGCARLAFAQGSLIAVPHVGGTVNEAKLVALTGSVHPLAVPKYDKGAVPDNFALDHMYLVLRRSPEQQKALDDLVADLQDPRSANYHHWLTANELGKRYGPAQADIDAVVNWLGSHALQVNRVSKSGMVVDVSGTAGQLREAFHTEIHQYEVNGVHHIANASDPQVPAALAPVIAGFKSLHDFMPKPLVRKPIPGFTFSYQGLDYWFEGPQDFATIYNVAPLWKGANAITGKGQTVVVLEATDIQPQDVAKFRSVFGLSSFSGTFSQIHPQPYCDDPGRNGDEFEAAIDAEWAGVAAPDAAVVLASCANSQVGFGPFIAATNLLDSVNPPPIMSLSYESCEAANGPGNIFIGDMWEQAAVEGVSVFVASGDGGPAGCDDFNTEGWAITGIQANALASTPYNVATGGTDFLDTFDGTNGAYWANSNGPGGKSAKSYVPEMPWNDSCASSILFEFFGYTDGFDACNDPLLAGYLDIVATAGAPSMFWAKPYWQKNTVGVPNDGVRDVPDLSLFSANGLWGHALLFCMSDAKQGGSPCDYSNAVSTFSNSAGGTSFTAPQFAGIQALFNQKAGSAQGNPAPIYYDLYRLQFGSPTNPNTRDLQVCNASLGYGVSPGCFFHDVTVGNDDIPCYGPNNCYGGSGLNYGVLSLSDSLLQPAYPAHTGWDFATGLGSVNVAKLVSYWP